MIFFSTFGTVLGYHVDYLLGRFALVRLLTRWSAGRFGRRLRLAGRLRLSRSMLSKHGGKAILLSHTIGHLRSFVAMSAGLTHMSYARFLLFEIIAALLWNTIYSLIGYFIAVEIDLLRLFLSERGWSSLPSSSSCLSRGNSGNGATGTRDAPHSAYNRNPRCKER